MIIELLTSWVSIGLWLATIVFIIVCLGDKAETIQERLKLSLFLIIFGGLCGSVFSIPGIISPIRSQVISYEVPTIIYKTNNIVTVVHIDDRVVVSRNFLTTDYWNATNIMVKVINGKNFYNFDVHPEYEIVLK